MIKKKQQKHEYKKKERQLSSSAWWWEGECQGLSLKACLLFQDTLPRPDMEERLRSASTVDELMTLIYPSYWATLKCTSKLSSVAPSPRSASSGRQRLPASAEDLAFSAVYLNLDVLKSTTFPVPISLMLVGVGLQPRPLLWALS